MAMHSVRRSRTIRRSTSLLAVVVSVVVVAGLLAAAAAASPASDEADAQKNKALVLSGPMTPLKAKLQGKTNVDFGPNCDTTTGRVKIPLVYSPPCVQPFTGKNGGATSQGVTGNEIKIVVYTGDPQKDPLLAGQAVHGGVVCHGTCALAMPQRISDQNKPYIFTEGPSPEEAATLTAEFIGKQAGPGKAQFAGNDATKNKNRVYGIVHYDTP